MTTLLFTALFIIAAAITILLFLLSLRKLGSIIKNYASLFTGIDLLLASIYIGDQYAQIIDIALGVFVTVFAAIKIIRKMD